MNLPTVPLGSVIFNIESIGRQNEAAYLFEGRKLEQTTEMPPVQRIYIAGFMGVGKSTVSPRVAKKLGFDVMDLDAEIVRHLGLSIPGIFEVMGEEIFRETEYELLSTASEATGLVVSLGGGAICREKTLQLCLDTGLLIYLKSSARALAHRLARSRQARPLLFDERGTMLKGEKLVARIDELLAVREPFYNRAHITITVDEFTTYHIAATIEREFHSWRKSP